MAVRWEIQTATGAPGAIGAAQLRGADAAELAGALGALGIDPVPVGSARLRDLWGIDRAVVARWTPESAWLMPHGGPRVMRRVAAELSARVGPAEGLSDRARFPEAATLLEARVLAALARACSPLAVGLLLDQARRWPAESADAPDPARPPGGEAPAALGRLLSPALVVAVGAANIGKSALVNALAGRTVSIVADEPGTTRDHVGVLLDCAGLIVRYVDTPGVRDNAGPMERQSAEIAAGLVARADLVLRCGDAGRAPVTLGADRASMRIGLRADLGAAAWGPELSVSALRGEGLAELVRAVRERLVPEGALRDPRPWRFWEGAP
jgi:hypothetical protein